MFIHKSSFASTRIPEKYLYSLDRGYTRRKDISHQGMIFVCCIKMTLIALYVPGSKVLKKGMVVNLLGDR